MYRQACGASRDRHGFGVGAAVGRRRVHVDVAAEIGGGDEPGQGLALGGLDFTAVLAQLRRHRLEVQRGVDVLLAGARDPLLVLDAIEPVLVQLQAAPQGAVAQRDVVRLRPGEVLHRRPQAVAWHQPQVGLESAPEQHAGLRLAVREDAFHQHVAGEAIHQRRRRAGGEDVDVAAGVAAPAQAADDVNRNAGSVRPEDVDEGARGLVRLARQSAAAEIRPLLEGLQDEGLLLRPHALDLAQPAVARRRFELFERADAELPVEKRHGLRADALQVQQVEDGRRELPQQFLVIRHAAGLDQFPDARVEVLADSRDREPFGWRQIGDTYRRVRDRLRGVAIRADLERVLGLDLEQVANLGEDARDGEVLEAHRRCSDVSRGSGRQAVTRVSTRSPSVSMRKSRIRPPAPATASRIAGTRSGSPRQNRQPPPPAPQTLPP